MGKSKLNNKNRHSEGVKRPKNLLLQKDSSLSFRMTKQSVFAITLAEIMIVVVIVAVIALVFMAMPKKNVGKMDRAKYYIAYNTLKRLQDEQMSEDGSVKVDSKDNFKGAVEKWLNTLKTAGDQITLTNGMVLRLENNPSPCYTAGDAPTCLKVKVDIDGDENGNCEENQDCHTFTLDSKGGVTPETHTSDGNLTTDWIGFKVYHTKEITKSGGAKEYKTYVDKTNVPFVTAKEYQCCMNKGIDSGVCYYIDDAGSKTEINEDYCGSTTGTTSTLTGQTLKWGGEDTTYFIEAIPPLK